MFTAFMFTVVAYRRQERSKMPFARVVRLETGEMKRWTLHIVPDRQHGSPSTGVCPEEGEGCPKQAM